MNEKIHVSKEEQEDPSSTFIVRVKEAVGNSQYLVAHAAKKGIDVNRTTVEVLIDARNAVRDNNWSPKLEIDFWEAYKEITKAVSPATVESVKALYPSDPSGLSKRFGKSKARRTVNMYTAVAVVVLAVLLILQIYWVIGNTLTNKLTGLLQREMELTTAINDEVKRYTEIELRFMMNEADQEGFQSGGTYGFYTLPDWQRETLDSVASREKLEYELDNLKQRLDRNAAVLLDWHRPLSWFTKPDQEEPENEEFYRIKGQIEAVEEEIQLAQAKIDRDPDASAEIAENRAQLVALMEKQDELVATTNQENIEEPVVQLAELKGQISALESWLNEPGRAELVIGQRQQVVTELNKQLADLEHQLARQKTREASRRAILTAEFVLIVLQSYFLPLLYGLLGATAFILRSLAKSIKSVTYSKQSDINYILRLALGSLAGLVVGWFIYLLPSSTFLSSVSPLAIAFLVGYNIEILFTLMDKLIDAIGKTEQAQGEDTAPDNAGTSKQPLVQPAAGD